MKIYRQNHINRMYWRFWIPKLHLGSVVERILNQMWGPIPRQNMGKVGIWYMTKSRSHAQFSIHWRVSETKPLKPAFQTGALIIHDLGAPGRIDGKNGQEHQQSPCKWHLEWFEGKVQLVSWSSHSARKHVSQKKPKKSKINRNTGAACWNRIPNASNAWKRAQYMAYFISWWFDPESYQT